LPGLFGTTRDALRRLLPSATGLYRKLLVSGRISVPSMPSTAPSSSSAAGSLSGLTDFLADVAVLPALPPPYCASCFLRDLATPGPSTQRSDGDERRCVSCIAAARARSASPSPPLEERRLGDGHSDDITAAEFAASFRNQQPLILRRLADDWAAVFSWRDAAHLAALESKGDKGVSESEMSEKTVLVLSSKNGKRFLKRDCDQAQRPFGDVVAELWPKVEAVAAAGAAAAQEAAALAHETAAVTGSFYARAALSDSLLAECDVSAIEALIGQPLKQKNCGVWMGSGGNITPFHYDLCHGFLVQILGEKTFTLVEPRSFRCMYQQERNSELSSVDFEAYSQAPEGSAEAKNGSAAENEASAADVAAGVAERSKHPKFAAAALRTVTLQPVQ